MTLAIALGLYVERQFAEGGAAQPASRFLRRLTALAFLVLLTLAALNVVTTAIECGLGACPDNPTRFL